MHRRPSFRADQQDCRKRGHQRGGQRKVQPNARELQRPQRGHQQHREEEGVGDRQQRSRQGLVEGGQTALRGKAKPSRQIGQAEQAQRGGGCRQQRRVSRLHEQGGNLPREEKEPRGGGKRYGRACSKAADLQRPDPGNIFCAPVVAHRRLERIAQSVQHRLHQIARIHQHAIDRYGALPAPAQKQGVHDDRGQTPRHIAEKRGAAAEQNLPHHAEAEAGPAKPQQHLPAQKGEDRNPRTEQHGKAICQRRCGHVPAEHIQKQELQHNRGRRQQNVQQHAAPDSAADAQKVVHGEQNGRGRGKQGVGSQIQHGKGRKIALRAECANHRRGGGKQDGAHENTGGDDHQAGAGKIIVGLRLLLPAEVGGDQHSRAHADEVGEREIDEHKGEGQVQRGKGRFPQHLADEDAVNQRVQGAGQHADDARYGRRQEKPHRRRFCKQCFGIPHGLSICSAS